MLNKSLRIPELDGVRGSAILTVLIFHWIISEGGSGILPQSINNLGKFGWSGVDLFFVLSGFLITGILLDTKHSENYFKVFYLRRLYRIVPLYLVILILTILIYHIDIPQGAHNWLFGHILPWQSYIFFAQNFSMAIENSMGSKMIDATWSLAVEEQFYLSLPFIIRFVSKSKLPYLFLAGIFTAPAIRVFLYFLLGPEDSATANYVLPFCRMDALCIGALGAWLIRHPSEHAYIHNLHPYLMYFISLLFFAGVFTLANMNLGFNSFILISIGYTWIAFFYFSLIWISLKVKSSLVAKVFRLKFLAFFGTLAYGIYLLHQPILGITHAILRGSSPLITERYAFFVTFLAFFCLIIVTYLSWIYFEKPLIKLGHKHKYNQ